MELQGWCYRCKKKQNIQNGQTKTCKNGRKLLQGTCAICKGKVNRFLANSSK